MNYDDINKKEHYFWAKKFFKEVTYCILDTQKEINGLMFKNMMP